MFESLTEYVSGLPWTYVFLFVIAALDVIIPLVPSETSVILAGVLASTGDLELVLVILFAAGGAILGDNIAYWIGEEGRTPHRRPWLQGRAPQTGGLGAQTGARSAAEYLIIIGRFIPEAGRLSRSRWDALMPWRRFIAFDVVAGLVWGTYAAMLGYVGGRTFEENPLKGFLLAFVVALGIAGVIEAYRRNNRRSVVADS